MVSPLEQYLAALDPADAPLAGELAQRYGPHRDLPTLEDPNRAVADVCYTLAAGLGADLSSLLGRDPLRTVVAHSEREAVDALVRDAAVAEARAALADAVDDAVVRRYVAACGVPIAQGEVGLPLAALARAVAIVAGSRRGDHLVEWAIRTGAQRIALAQRAAARAAGGAEMLRRLAAAPPVPATHLGGLAPGQHADGAPSTAYGGAYRALGPHLDAILERAWARHGSEEHPNPDLDAPVTPAAGLGVGLAALDPDGFDGRSWRPGASLRTYCRAVWDEVCAGVRPVRARLLTLREISRPGSPTRRSLVAFAVSHGTELAGPWAVLDEPGLFYRARSGTTVGVVVVAHAAASDVAVGWNAGS